MAVRVEQAPMPTTAPVSEAPIIEARGVDKTYDTGKLEVHALREVTFTVPQADLARAMALLEEQKDAIGYFRMISDDNVAKISVVGVGMRSHAGIASTMFKSLAERGINILAISTSEIKVSVLINADETELAVRLLHTAYGLDAKDEAA